MAASDSNPLRDRTRPRPEGQAVRLGEIGGLLATVAISALVIELVDRAAAVPAHADRRASPLGDAVLDSFYYSAMAFTNTGFTPNAEGLARVRERLLVPQRCS